MTRTQFEFTSTDGLQIACARWEGLGAVRGVVQIAHGMGEHIGRYSGVIDSLVNCGLRVYGNDHRGHGRTATSRAGLGNFGANGFDALVGDIYRLNRIATKENTGLPLILMGHSMGSFAAQQFAIDHSREIDGLILSGSGALDGLAKVAAAAPAGTNILNAAFEPSRTPCDWLSRDPAVVDAFLADPLCFPQLQPSSFASFLAAAPRLADANSLRTIRASLPIYLFSGSEDPVGQQLSGVEVLMQRYRNARVCNLSHDFYPGGRHEMLNEINRSEVIERLLGWISALVGRPASGRGALQ